MRNFQDCKIDKCDRKRNSCCVARNFNHQIGVLSLLADFAFLFFSLMNIYMQFDMLIKQIGAFNRFLIAS